MTPTTSAGPLLPAVPVPTTTEPHTVLIEREVRRADVRERALRALYPEHAGKFVAYRERWDGERLLEPFVVAVGESELEIERQLDALVPEVTADAVVRYLQPDQSALLMRL